MASTTNIRGLDRSLRKLREIDPKLEREAKKNLKRDAKVIVDDAKRRVPTAAPLSRWVEPRGAASSDGRYGKSRLPVWNGPEARRRIGVSIRRKGVRGYSGRRLLIAVRQGSASGAVFDIAGRASRNQFGQNLSSKYGGASRSMWPAAEAHLADVRESMRRTVLEVERQINAELRRPI